MWAERSCVRFWPETRRGEDDAHPHPPDRPPTRAAMPPGATGLFDRGLAAAHGRGIRPRGAGFRRTERRAPCRECLRPPGFGPRGQHRSRLSSASADLADFPGRDQARRANGRAGQAGSGPIRRATSHATAFSGASSESVPRLRRILRCGPTRPRRPPRRPPSR